MLGKRADQLSIFIVAVIAMDMLVLSAVIYGLDFALFRMLMLGKCAVIAAGFAVSMLFKAAVINRRSFAVFVVGMFCGFAVFATFIRMDMLFQTAIIYDVSIIRSKCSIFIGRRGFGVLQGKLTFGYLHI